MFLAYSMKIKVFIEEKNEHKTVTLDKGSTITSLLSTLKQNPVAVVVAKNDAIVPEETPLSEGDDIKIFSVISGG